MKFDASKRYSYEWPGQPRRTVDGAELNAFVGGAYLDMLNVREEHAHDSPKPQIATISLIAAISGLAAAGGFGPPIADVDE